MLHDGSCVVENHRKWTRVPRKWDKRQMQTDALIASGSARFVQETSCVELQKDANAKVELEMRDLVTGLICRMLWRPRMTPALLASP